MEGQSAVDFGPYVVLGNSIAVCLLLIAFGWLMTRRPLTDEVPGNLQNIGEWVLDFFVGKARDVAHGPKHDKIVRTVGPLLATFFMFIFISNLICVLPIPILNRPPTSHFSVTLALALTSVGATIGMSMLFKGVGGALKHLVWPNPMQLISEFTDVFSLALRLFGNIGGEYMTLLLVTAVVPYGIPLVLHVLGVIPAFVQALVFTLLSASFIASAVHQEEKKPKVRKERRFSLHRKAKVEPSLEGGS